MFPGFYISIARTDNALLRQAIFQTPLNLPPGNQQQRYSHGQKNRPPELLPGELWAKRGKFFNKAENQSIQPIVKPALRNTYIKGFRLNAYKSIT